MTVERTHNTSDLEKTKYLKINLGKNILPLSAAENKYMPGAGPIEIIISYKRSTAVSRGIECFLKAADYYNLFSSRLIMIGENTFALQYCTDGIVINVLPPVQARFDDVRIDDLREKMTHVQTLPGHPLLALTLIPVNDGHFVGFSCSHAVADGISCILFLYTWNCLIEGKPFPRPSAQRLFSGNPIPSDHIEKDWMPPLSALSEEIQNRVRRGAIKTYTTTEYFSDEFLTEMKHQAQANNGEVVISNNQIMTAWLLKKYHHHILPHTDKIVIRTPVDLRTVHPGVDPMYIGYAVINSFSEFPKEEIDHMSVVEMACRLKESIHHTRTQRFIQEATYLSKYGIEIQEEVLKQFPPYNPDTDIVSTNMTHLSDLESLFLGPDAMRIEHIGVASVKTSFAMVREKNGQMSAQITSRYPLI